MPTNSRDDSRPRSMSGGLMLPPRQQPLPPAPAPSSGTSRIVTGITSTVAGAIGAIRRAAAEQGLS